MTLSEERALYAISQLPRMMEEYERSTERRHVENMIIQLEASGETLSDARIMVKSVKTHTERLLRGEEVEPSGDLQELRALLVELVHTEHALIHADRDREAAEFAQKIYRAIALVDKLDDQS